MHIFNYSVIHLQQLTQYVTQILLQPDSQQVIQFQAGQYIKVVHADASLSPMSIAAAPQKNNQIELHLSHHASNHSALDILQQAREQKKLQLLGPFGNCTLAQFIPSYPIIFMARGTGLAPIKAFIETMLIKDNERNCHLFWDAASDQRFYLLDFISSWQQKMKNLRVTYVLSQSEEQYKLREAVIKEYPNLTAYQVYASGPPSMVFAALDYFVQQGLSKSRFYSDVL
jgi:CDP-4-dehydro-6-deoxyglucose reductase, E3